jgi:hypothetical protein
LPEKIRKKFPIESGWPNGAPVVLTLAAARKRRCSPIFDESNNTQPVLRRAGIQTDGQLMEPGSAAHRHSALKTRANALMAAARHPGNDA